MRSERPTTTGVTYADHAERERLAAGALARARRLTWDASALGVLRVFHRVVMRGT